MVIETQTHPIDYAIIDFSWKGVKIHENQETGGGGGGGGGGDMHVAFLWDLNFIHHRSCECEKPSSQPIFDGYIT